LFVGIVEQGHYDVAALGSKRKAGDKDASYDALDDLEKLEANHQSQVHGIFELFSQYAAEGRAGLTDHQMHHADQGEGILEFIRGRIRVMCFQDDHGLVLLCCANLKNTKKADKKSVKRAIRLKKDYLKAKGEDNLNIEVLGED
jgi:Phage derived protein Gp49-like (DUF891).